MTADPMSDSYWLEVADRRVEELEVEVERLQKALREVISWSYGEDMTPERRDHLERLLDGCICNVTEPDRDGNRDLIPNPDCPVHS